MNIHQDTPNDSLTQVTSLLNFALTEVVERGTARTLNGLLNRDTIIAGKTGTTNERRDSWFVGYTQQRVAAVWVGLDDNRPAGVTGGNAAMRVWADLFKNLPIKEVDLRMPDGANYIWVDPLQYKLTGPDCDNAIQVPFIDGTEPQEQTRCLKNLSRKNDKSFWSKFTNDND